MANPPPNPARLARSAARTVSRCAIREPRSISRVSIDWGVPVPWDTAQSIYVWVDALLNYRTAQEYGLGRDVTSEFWPTSLHLMAKDILRLHGIIWPAMLQAAEIDR